MSLRDILGGPPDRDEVLAIVDALLIGRIDGVWLASVSGDHMPALVFARPDGLALVVWAGLGWPMDIAATLPLALEAVATGGSQRFSAVADGLTGSPRQILQHAIDLLARHDGAVDVFSDITTGATP